MEVPLLNVFNKVHLWFKAHFIVEAVLKGLWVMLIHFFFGFLVAFIVFALISFEYFLGVILDD